MLKTYIHFLRQKTNGKVCLLFLFLYLIFPVLIFPLSGKLQQKYSGNATPPLDLEFGFSPEYAFNRVEEYGAPGRKIYAISAMTADIAYPVIYSTFLALLILYLGGKSGLGNNRQDRAAYFPFAAAIADILENGGIVTMLCTFPAKYNTLAVFTSAMNMIKWILIIISILIIVLILVRWIFNSINQK